MIENNNLTDREKKTIIEAREQITKGIHPIGYVAEYIQVLFIKEYLEKIQIKKAA